MKFKKRGRHVPITEEDKIKMKELVKTHSLSEAAIIMKRPPGSIARAIRNDKKEKVKKGFFDWSLYA